MEKEKAIEITVCTLLGIMPVEQYPINHGNCFSVQTQKGNHYRIVNFCLENLQEAIRRGISWPITILPLSSHAAAIHDERIPGAWYSNTYCTICCPDSLQLQPKLLQWEREELCGARTVIKDGEREYIGYDMKKLPKL